MFTSRFYFPAACRAGEQPTTGAPDPARSRLTRVSHFGRLPGPTHQLAPAGCEGFRRAGRRANKLLRPSARPTHGGEVSWARCPGGRSLLSARQSGAKIIPTMISLDVPDFGLLELHHLVSDYNGTLALDGFLHAGVAERIRALAKLIEIHVITADTFGVVREQLAGLPVTLT